MKCLPALPTEPFRLFWMILMAGLHAHALTPFQKGRSSQALQFRKAAEDCHACCSGINTGFFYDMSTLNKIYPDFETGFPAALSERRYGYYSKIDVPEKELKAAANILDPSMSESILLFAMHCTESYRSRKAKEICAEPGDERGILMKYDRTADTSF